MPPLSGAANDTNTILINGWWELQGQGQGLSAPTGWAGAGPDWRVSAAPCRGATEGCLTRSHPT